VNWASQILAACGFMVLNNLVFVLLLAGRYGVWVVLPPCDVMLLLFLVYCMLHYYLWLRDVSVLFVVLFSCYLTCCCRLGLITEGDVHVASGRVDILWCISQ
jgi:hypothetical protein